MSSGSGNGNGSGNGSVQLSVLLDEPIDFGRRLFKSPKGNIREEKTANDALVSDLPSETLRWIKKRRNFDSGKKVVLSHHRERQLREIFQGIDIGRKGVIELKEINEAVSFVQNKLKNTKGLEKFRNIQSVFSSMDDNGDGTVDFQEFTNAMTGSSDSALDTTSEHDIEKLYRCFVEFGVLKHRKKAVETLAEYTGYTINLGTRKSANRQPGSPAVRPKTIETLLPHQVLGRAPPKDVECYKLFKTLFGNEESTFVGGTESKAADTMADKEAEALRVSSVERVLEQFIESTKQSGRRNEEITDEEKEREEEYFRLQEKLRESRKNELINQASDPDAVALQQRLLEEKRHSALAQKLRVGTAGRPTTSTGIRKVTPATLIPIDPNTKLDQATRLSAKRDAYEILKSNRTSSNLNPIDIRKRGALQLDNEDQQSASQGSRLSFCSRSADSLHSTAAASSQHSLAPSLHSRNSEHMSRNSGSSSLHPLLNTSKSACLSLSSPKAMKSNMHKSHSTADVF